MTNVSDAAAWVSTASFQRVADVTRPPVTTEPGVAKRAVVDLSVHRGPAQSTASTHLTGLATGAVLNRTPGVARLRPRVVIAASGTTR